jgi:hypothetical protein
MSRKTGPTEARFWKRVKIDPSGCWLWQGSTARSGYGQFRAFVDKKKSGVAHRFSYQLYRAEIPTGMILDHLCRVHRCVNPEHLEPVSYRENIRRGLQGVLRTHCKRGHEQIGDNILMRGNGKTSCKPCRRASAAINNEKQKTRIQSERARENPNS